MLGRKDVRMLIHVLSIDWDYYINVNKEKRKVWFPDIPEDLLTEEDRELLWKPYYEQFDLSRIGIMEDDFENTKKVIKNCKLNHNLIKRVKDSHRYIYDVIYEVMHHYSVNEVTVYNIDYHHDMYQYRIPNERVNCSNWAAILQEELGNSLDYYWIKRDDSEEYSLAGKVDCKLSNIADINSINFDVLYLCKSGAWSPPHLDTCYQELVSCLYE